MWSISDFWEAKDKIAKYNFNNLLDEMGECAQGYLKMWIYSFDPLKYTNSLCCSHDLMPGLAHSPTENAGTTQNPMVFWVDLIQLCT